MWIKTNDGALINLDQCHAMHMKEFRGAYIVTFDTAAGHAVQVKSGTEKECKEFFDLMSSQLVCADANSQAIIASLNTIAQTIKDKT